MFDLNHEMLKACKNILPGQWAKCGDRVCACDNQTSVCVASKINAQLCTGKTSMCIAEQTMCIERESHSDVAFNLDMATLIQLCKVLHEHGKCDLPAIAIYET